MSTKLRAQVTFTMVPHWLLEAGLSPRALQLYIALGRYVRNDTGEAAPVSAKRLAADCGCTVQALAKPRAELVEAGALLVDATFGPTGQGANTYTLMIAKDCYPPTTTVGGALQPQMGGTPTTTVVPKSFKTVEPKPEREDKSSLSHAPVERARARRAQDVAFDALALATDADPDVEGGRIARALGVIRKAFERDQGVKLSGKRGETDEGWAQLAREIERRARLYESYYGAGVELTPTALSNNWSRVVKKPPARSGVSVDALLYGEPAADDVDGLVRYDFEGELVGEEES